MKYYREIRAYSKESGMDWFATNFYPTTMVRALKQKTVDKKLQAKQYILC